jgi:hypothetical protein
VRSVKRKGRNVKTRSLKTEGCGTPVLLWACHPPLVDFAGRSLRIVNNMSGTFFELSVPT